MFIIGGNGLLGSALVKKTNADFSTRKDCDLLKDDFETYLKSINKNPSTIIHSCAKVGGVGANSQNNIQFFKENTKIDNNVLSACLNLETENLVTILSTCIFPDKITHPLIPYKIDLGPPHNSNYGYSYAKRLLYYQTKTYAKALNKNWISIIPTNLYGMNDNFNLNDSHLIPALIRKAYESKLNDSDFVIWGDGTPLRQFVYSEDLAEIILWAVDNWKQETALMAINEKEYSIKQIVKIIADRFNIPDSKIKFDSSKPNGQFKKTAKTDIDWFKFTPIEEGINKTIDWFIESYDKGIIRL